MFKVGDNVKSKSNQNISGTLIYSDEVVAYIKLKNGVEIEANPHDLELYKDPKSGIVLTDYDYNCIVESLGSFIKRNFPPNRN